MIKEEFIDLVKSQVKEKDLYIRTGWSEIFVKKGCKIRFGDLLFYVPIQAPYGVRYGNVLEVSTKPRLRYGVATCTVGCDPEFFFVNESGDVVPSQMVIPLGDKDVVRDGFQGELNPEASYCRQVAGGSIAAALLKAYRYANDNGVALSLDSFKIITDKSWKMVDKSIKRFGCNPTMNVHENNFKRPTGLRERFRAAGGHIHIGVQAKYRKDIKTLVSLMDIFAGNTCVLIDRNKENARRRKIYGRAGEYREKPYGLEYRVLSNFWLRSYTLWSMVSVLCRNAVDVHANGLSKELLSRFDMDKVRKAINENDFELAKENFEILKKFIHEHSATGNGLSRDRIDKVYKWATGKRDPLKSWDTLDKTIKSWRSKLNTIGIGFETYIDRKR